MNVSDIVIIILTAIALILALRHIYKKRKSGCSCCCGQCGKNCPANLKK